MFDFVVIGGGPSGSYCTQRLAKRGFKVAQLEEHQSIGKPVECTGLVSRRVTSMVKTDSVVNKVHGANIYFPDGNHIRIGKEEETIVLERDRFDQDAAAMSIGNGAELMLNARVKDIRRQDRKMKITMRRDGNIEEVEALAVVGADGANSITRKVLFPDQRFRRIVSAYQIDGADRMEDQDNVNVFLGNKFSNGYFAWGTPAGDFSRIGTAGFGLTREKFNYLYKRYLNPNKISITGGPIPISFLRRPNGDGALLVGDAAGIVKPLSGGGIYTGMVSGEKAAITMERAYEKEDFSEGTLSLYNKLWKKELGAELKRDFRIQKLYSRITDTSFNIIGRKITTERMTHLINTIGDIDYPSRVVLKMLIRNPSIVRNVLFPRKEKNAERN
ncbi:MAG: NAD(P)/FAD-dependent oxidoreductase [Candidatus Thermoplasmatota archaeon]|nr:NAD(P)/FAD-dependent oxidoreductase [Candidatus Thermoplasmatota archaeon]